MLGYDDVAVFLRVAREGSFVSAARSLGLPTSSVSRRVAALEQRLKTQLLRRTTRAVALTEDGRAFADRCLSAMDELEAATRGLDLCNSRLSGRLTVTAPHHVNETFVPHLLAFAAANPDLVMDLRLKNGVTDLIEEGVDVAFQLTPLPEGRHVARKLWAVPYGVYAGRPLLNRVPEIADLNHPSRLTQFPVVLTPPIRTWRFVARSGDGWSFTPRLTGAAVDDLAFGALAVRAGLGIGYLPTGLGRHFPDLIELTFGDWLVAERELFAVYSSTRELSPKIRAIIDHALAVRASLGIGPGGSIPSVSSSR